MKQQNQTKKVVAAVTSVLVLACAAVFVHTRLQQKQDLYQLKIDEDALEHIGEETAHYRKIEVDGKTYRYNTSIRNILYMGIDTQTDDSDEESLSTSSAGQADSFMLISIDRRNNDMHIIAIPRDTMTQIRMYDNTGQYLGKAQQHLSLSYAYGDGGKQSCLLAAEAVSQLLHDIPINNYISTNISSIGAINDLVGGVTVTIPGDDLEYLGRQYRKGRTLTLDSETAEIFVRSRNIEEDFTNQGRMLRQKVFVTQLFSQMKKRIDNDLDGLLEDIDKIGDTSVTNLRSSDIQDLLVQVSDHSITSENYHILEGSDEVGDLHDEFYIDDEKLVQLLLDIYYVEF